MGLMSVGCNVLYVGTQPTPIISHLTRKHQADMGLIVTASHNDETYQGVKVFNSKGIKIDDKTEKQISERFEKPIKENYKGHFLENDDAHHPYVEKMADYFLQYNIKDMKILIADNNSAGNEALYEILSILDINYKTINTGNINILGKNVVKHNCECGIMMDSDADRLLMTDEKGKPLNGDDIIGIFATDLKEVDLVEKDTVVLTEYSNTGLIEYLKSIGLKTSKVINGDKLVAKRMREKNYNIGGEQTGHIMLGDDATPDAISNALMMLSIIKLNDKPLSEIRIPYKKHKQKIINIKDYNKETVPKMTHLSKQDDLRILTRFSGTEKTLRVMVETKKGNLNEIEKEVRKIVNK